MNNYQEIKQKLLENDFQVCGFCIAEELIGEIPDVINIYCQKDEFIEKSNLLKFLFNVKDTLEILPHNYGTDKLTQKFFEYTNINKNILDYMRANKITLPDGLLANLTLLNDNYMNYLKEKTRIGMRFELEQIKIDLLFDITYFQDFDIYNLCYNKDGIITSLNFNEDYTKQIIENISNKIAIYTDQDISEEYIEKLTDKGWTVDYNL